MWQAKGYIHMYIVFVSMILYVFTMCFNFEEPMFYRLHIPEIRVVQPGELKFKKDTKVVLTFSNPATTNTKIQFAHVEGNEGETVTAKVSLTILIYKHKHSLLCRIKSCVKF